MHREKLEALRAGLSRLPVNPEGGQFTRENTVLLSASGKAEESV